METTFQAQRQPSVQETEEQEDAEASAPAPAKKRRTRQKGTGKCAGCEEAITNCAVFCIDCAAELQPKKFEATKEELHDLVHVQKLSYVAIGKRFGVSDNAIRKRCTSLGVPNRKRATK